MTILDSCFFGFDTNDIWRFLLVCFSVLFVFVYYFFTWLLFGKDPEKRTIIPVFEPPADLSPAQMRFFIKTYLDDKCITATIVSCANKGHLKVQESEYAYSLQKLEDSQTLLADEEKAFMNALFERHLKIDINKNKHTVTTASIKTKSKAYWGLIFLFLRFLQ